jgi:hypothetical protein
MTLLFILLGLLQTPVGRGTVQGLVLNASQEPINTARVELVGPNPEPFIARTNNDGQFVFSNIPTGRYRLSVKKEGFVRQEYGEKKTGDTGTVLVVEAGARTPNIVFRLQRASTISGVVRNEESFPIANILVQALKRSFNSRGRRTVTVFASTLTDDLGAYRLYWLDPGDYYVSASYMPKLPTPVNANDDAPRVPYAPSFFPGTVDPAGAQIVHLENGRSTNADFNLKRSPTANVRGTITEITRRALPGADVTLASLEGSGSASRYDTRTDEKGVFEIRNVNAGTYVLSAKSATDPNLMGFATIQIFDVDNPRADLTIGPGTTVNAKLFGQAPATLNPAALQVSLVPLESFLPQPKPSGILPTGAFAIANVQPGDYTLRVSGLPEGGYVKAAQINQIDALEQFVRVQYENSSLDIEVVFDGGQIGGSVLDAAGRPFAGATVVAVPSKALRHRPDQYRVGRSGADGKFSFGSVPPGEYKLFAWESIETNAWMNSDVLQAVEDRGSAATVGPNEKISTQLQVIQ